MKDHKGKKFANFFSSLAGQFADHIAASIPSFAEMQSAVCQSLANIYADSDKFILDIGASEGNFAILLNKCIDQLKKKNIFTYSLDPNKEMHEKFVNDNKNIYNLYIERPFMHGFDDYEDYFPINKYPIISEFMTFQFIDNDRMSQYKAVSEALTDDGVFITASKVFNQDKALYEANEAKKDAYKLRSFTQDEIDLKKEKVLVDMGNEMSTQHETEQALQANFYKYRKFWHSGNFIGFVAIKSKKGENYLNSFDSFFDSFFDRANEL